MFVTFRIIDTETQLHSKPAHLTGRELASIRRLLAERQILTEEIEPDEGELTYDFDVNANSVALASFARVLDYRTDIIAIVEEAQFLGRNLRIERDENTGEITLRVSRQIALSDELTTSHDRANQILNALGIDGDTQPSISIETLKERLGSPANYETVKQRKLEALYDHLTGIAFTDMGEQQPELEWT